MSITKHLNENLIKNTINKNVFGILLPLSWSFELLTLIGNISNLFTIL